MCRVKENQSRTVRPEIRVPALQLQPLHLISQISTPVPLNRFPLKDLQLPNLHTVPTKIRYQNKRYSRGYSRINPKVHIIILDRWQQDEPELHHRQ